MMTVSASSGIWESLYEAKEKQMTIRTPCQMTGRFLKNSLAIWGRERYNKLCTVMEKAVSGDL